MSRGYASVTGQDRADARLIWGYHHMGHEPRPCSAGIGLGSYAERAISRGIPRDAIIIEPHATNTGENIEFSRPCPRHGGHQRHLGDADIQALRSSST